MKICPNCSFANDDSFPTCAWCNALIVNVPSVASSEATNTEHERAVLATRRRSILRGRLTSASIFYALVITLPAVFPGGILNIRLLLLYFASALFVALTVTVASASRGVASLLQGILSLVLVLYFGPAQPLIFFMLLAHIILPSIFHYWVEMIVDMNR